MVMGFKDFLGRHKKILIELPEKNALSILERLDEATRATVGRYTARRDPPHFQGDEYHGHADIPGGYEVAWGVSGARRHPNKFPAEIPADAKAAVAKVLKVSVDILETYAVHDEKVGEEVILIEVREP